MEDIFELLVEILGAVFTIKEIIETNKIPEKNLDEETEKIKASGEKDGQKWENLGRPKFKRLKKSQKKKRKIY